MVIWRYFKGVSRWTYQALSKPANAMAIGGGLFLVVLLSTIALLGHRSLWLDEFFSIHFAAPDLPFAKALSDSIATDSQPPLYYGLLHFWLSWFGDGAAAVRSLNLLGFPMLAGAMAISWRMPLPRPAWLLFWCLLLTSRFTWDFITEARAYFLAISAGSLLAVLTYDMTLAIGDKRAMPPWQIVVFALAAIVASTLHYYGFIFAGSLIAVLFIDALIERRLGTAGIFAAIGALVLGIEIGWLAYSLPRLWFDPNGFWLTFAPVRETRLFITNAFSSNVVVLVLLALAAVTGFRNILKDRPIIVLVAAICLGYLAVVALSLRQPILYHRYLSLFLPALMLATTLILMRAMPKTAVLPVFLSVFLVSLPVAIARALPDREDWRGSNAYVESHYGPECETARIMMFGSGSSNVILTYLANGRDWASVRFDQKGYDEALSTTCPVVGWANTMAVRDVSQTLATIDLRGRHVEIIPFKGVALIVRGQP